MPKNLFLLLLCAITAHSCMIYIPTPKIFRQKELNGSIYYKDSCGYWNRLPLNYRLDEIPFKGAARIEVVSFENPYGIRDIQRPEDPPKPKIDHYNTFLERFTLSQKDIDTLSQIMNFSDTAIQIKPLPKMKNGIYDRNLGIKTVAGCFEPHHALLFYGKNGEQYARWDMCFHCYNHEIKGIYYYKSLESFGCSRQIDELKRIFKGIGIARFL